MSTIEIAETASESSSDDELPPDHGRANLTDEEVVVTEGAELEAHNRAMAGRRVARRARVHESEQRKAETLRVDLTTVDAHFSLPKPPTRLRALDHTYATYCHPVEAHQRRLEDAEYAQQYMELRPQHVQRQIEQRQRDGAEWSGMWSLDGYSKAGRGATGVSVGYRVLQTSRR